MDENSILLTIKHKLGGIVNEESYFDSDLIDYINSAFTKLWQLGVGPQDEPFKITGESETWDDFDCEFEMVKEYVYLDVLTVFDTPQNSTVLQAYKDRKFEDEWRLNIMSEEKRDG